MLLRLQSASLEKKLSFTNLIMKKQEKVVPSANIVITIYIYTVKDIIYIVQVMNIIFI